jgi:hypothetical protein
MPARLWIFQNGKPSFAFDAVIREQHARELTVPQEPVDTGYVISDHAFLMPDRLSIEAAVSDIALKPRTADPFASSKSRSVTAFSLIRGLQEALEPFSIQTGLLLYDSMMMTSFSGDQDAATDTALLFRAEFTRVKITSTRTITFPPRKQGKPARQGAKKVDNGNQSTKPADAGAVDSIALSLGKKSGFLQSVGLLPTP